MKVNETALKAWYKTEWARQVYLAEFGVMAFDTIRTARINGVMPDGEWEKARAKIRELNALITPWIKTGIEYPRIVTKTAFDNATELISGMDDWEKAAYDREGMGIIMGECFSVLAKPTPFTMLSYSITNHFWRKFGAKSSYQKWANPVRDYGNMCDDLEKIRAAIYRHLVVMLDLRRGTTDPFTGEAITPPAEFFNEEE